MDAFRRRFLDLAMQAQALRFGADVRQEKVSRVDLSQRPFRVWVGDPDASEPTYVAHSVIVPSSVTRPMRAPVSSVK